MSTAPAIESEPEKVIKMNSTPELTFADLKLTMLKGRGDGNCFFHAMDLAISIKNNRIQSDTQALRNRFFSIYVSAMKNYDEKLEEAIALISTQSSDAKLSNWTELAKIASDLSNNKGARNPEMYAQIWASVFKNADKLSGAGREVIIESDSNIIKVAKCIAPFIKPLIVNDGVWTNLFGDLIAQNIHNLLNMTGPATSIVKSIVYKNRNPVPSFMRTEYDTDGADYTVHVYNSGAHWQILYPTDQFSEHIENIARLHHLVTIDKCTLDDANRMVLKTERNTKAVTTLLTRFGQIEKYETEYSTENNGYKFGDGKCIRLVLDFFSEIPPAYINNIKWRILYNSCNDYDKATDELVKICKIINTYDQLNLISFVNNLIFKNDYNDSSLVVPTEFNKIVMENANVALVSMYSIIEAAKKDAKTPARPGDRKKKVTPEEKQKAINVMEAYAYDFATKNGLQYPQSSSKTPQSSSKPPQSSSKTPQRRTRKNRKVVP